MSTYYIGQGSDRKGPFSIDELRNQGVQPDTLIWREGMEQWAPAGSLPELASLFPPAQPAGGYPQGPQQPYGQPQQPYAPQGQYGQPQQYGQAPVPGYAGAPPFNAQEVNSKKLLAGILGIVLNGLGIHKFVLGFTGAGVIMLVVWVAGFFLCGIPTIVMGIIGLIEGILYLTKSDAEFYRLYIVERKQWF